MSGRQAGSVSYILMVATSHPILHLWPQVMTLLHLIFSATEATFHIAPLMGDPHFFSSLKAV